MKITFKANDYTSDDDFRCADYEFRGDLNSGWEILRNNKHYLTLGKGYTPLRARLCGICATDLARRFLPFPLPQVGGHEVLSENLEREKKFVVEINDTPYYRGDRHQDIFCKSGLFTHTPGRMVLGIDRLPGGFGPYFLAPKKSIIPIGNLNEYTAVLVEPFSAALQAIIASPPKNGDTVAVLGSGRLGCLLIAALHSFREATGTMYKINVIGLVESQLRLCSKLGSDGCINLNSTDQKSLRHQFDIVYDTTGAVPGFETALTLTNKEVHLKSTNGQAVCGLSHLTALVVDELSLLPYTDENLEFKWEKENRTNMMVYLAPGAKRISCSEKNLFKGDIREADTILNSPEFKDRIPRFDIAVATTLDEIDRSIRPHPENENSLVRPRGAILFKGNPGDNPLLKFISKGGKIRSSRCGDFQPALKLLKENKEISERLQHLIISHVFPAAELKTAFGFAKKSSALKVIIKHIH